MNQAAANEIVRQVAALAEAQYVFADVGGQISKLLTEHAAAGRYAEQPDLAGLAALVTEDLQAVNGDLHLRLIYSAEELPAGQDDDAEAAAIARMAEATAGGVARVERLDGNVGYLDLRPVLFPPSMAGDAMAAAMSLLAATDALIIDLRRCLGGEPGMVAMVCSYLFGDEAVHLMDLYERDGDKTRQSWTMPYVPGRRPGPAVPASVLVSTTTFSGGEELAYDLQQLGRAVIIGERTRGGAHPRRAFTVHPHLQATIPVARAVSPVTGANWEGTGVTPDIEVPAGDAFTLAYRQALEHVLGAAGAEFPGLPGTGAEARAALDRLAGPSAS